MRSNHNATRALVGILICMFAVGCTAEHGEDNETPSIQPGQNEQALGQLEFALNLTKNNFQVSERIMNQIISIKKAIGESRGF